jgi:tetratricopeptide (TPR) repeat protein
MGTDLNEPKSTSGMFAWYHGLAWFFSFMLALLWSVDTSFVYIFSGFATFFILMSLGTAPFLWRRKDPFENLFRQTKYEEETQGKAQTEFKTSRPPVSNTQKRIIAITFASFALFVIVVMIGVFSGSDDDDAEIYLNNAENYYRSNQFDSAAINYRRAFFLKPDYKEALIGYANVLQTNEDYDSAIIMYDKVLQTDPEYSPALYQQARTMYYQKNYDASVAQAKIVLNIDSSYVEAFQLIGDSFYAQEQYDSALIWYDDAYDKGVRNRYLCHLMGYLYQTKGNAQRAIGLYNEALQYDSTVLDIYERLEGIVEEPERSWCLKKIAELQNTAQQ